MQTLNPSSRKWGLALVPVVVVALSLSVVLAQMAPQATPTHAEILKGVGTWKGTLTMKAPGMPPEPMPATETVTAVGSLWTQARFECDFMGMPYVGTGCFGYDPDAKKMRGTWVDSTSTFLSVMEGEMDEESHTVTMRWKAPTMDGSMVDHRSVTVHSDDAYTSTFYVADGEGGEMEMMVIDMKRVAKGKEKSKATMKPEEKSKKKEKGGSGS